MSLVENEKQQISRSVLTYKHVEKYFYVQVLHKYLILILLRCINFVEEMMLM